MISLEELKKKANNLYKAYLENKLTSSSPFFPLDIPSNKGKASDNVFEREKELRELINNSKTNGKKSYLFETQNVNTRNNGLQTVIKRIYFENEEDYLSFIGKKESVKTFLASLNILKSNLTFTLENETAWALKHIDILSEKNLEDTSEVYWKNIAICASYLKDNPNSNLYMRSIPLEVHSKFIENNKSIIHSLLNEEETTVSESKFLLSHGLKTKPSFIRFRFLEDNKELSTNFAPSELNIPVNDFEVLYKASFMKDIKNIFIVENEIIYLTFPNKENSIVIWGHGFTADNFAPFKWLNNYNLYYFGDLDEHGYDILGKFRKHFPSTVSFCMDPNTFNTFSRFRVEGNILSGNAIPQNLNSEEMEVFNLLRENPLKNRLEQERINQSYIDSIVKNL